MYILHNQDQLSISREYFCFKKNKVKPFFCPTVLCYAVLHTVLAWVAPVERGLLTPALSWPCSTVQHHVSSLQSDAQAHKPLLFELKSLFQNEMKLTVRALERGVSVTFAAVC